MNPVKPQFLGNLVKSKGALSLTWILGLDFIVLPNLNGCLSNGEAHYVDKYVDWA